jgi:hypothetical protein
VNSFHSNPFKVVIEQEVHVAPFGVQRVGWSSWSLPEGTRLVL